MKLDMNLSRNQAISDLRHTWRLIHVFSHFIFVSKWHVLIVYTARMSNMVLIGDGTNAKCKVMTQMQVTGDRTNAESTPCIVKFSRYSEKWVFQTLKMAARHPSWIWSEK
jgi:hypothetical protein